jgi:DNA polymerase I-like protein with 3'-5' exonuclease and polymerase domains
MSHDLNYYFIGNASLFDEDYKRSTIEEAYSYLKDKKVISLDIETTKKFGGKYDAEAIHKYGKSAPQLEGLQPHLTEIVMVQIGDLEKQFVIDYREIDLGPLISLLIDPEIQIVGQNIKFEYLHFLHNEGIKLTNVYDTMIVERMLFNGLSVNTSLKALNEKYLGITVDKGTRLEFLFIGDRPFTLRQIEYGAEDILYPLLIREKQIPQLIEKDLWNCFTLEMKFLLCLGDIEYKGMHFNRDRWLNTYNKNLIKFEKLRDQLDQFILDNYLDTKFVDKQLDLFSGENFKCRISWTSSKQVIEFFRYLGACPLEKSKTTGKMAYTVNAKVVKSTLNTINKHQPDKIKEFLNLYLTFKESEQSCTTFGKSFFKHINPITGRLHSNYTQIINTGRISSSGPNLQNIPSGQDESIPYGQPERDMFRYCFDAPKGWKIVNADYSGQEQIILANKSQDKDLIAFYEKDLGDMHSYIASKIFPELSELSLSDIKKNHSDKRQMAKAAGFAINYGGTGFTIANNLGVSEEVGNFVYESYFKAFPGLNKFFTGIKNDAKRKGYILIDPLTGRKYWYDKSNMHKAEKLAMNYPIQGEAGGITKFAVILMRQWIMNNQLEDVISITNIVHDEINLEVKEEFAIKAAKALEECMTRAGAKWCKIVPLNADAQIVDYWTH